MDQFLSQLNSALPPFSSRGVPRHGRGRRRRLAENVLLDAPGLRPSGWTYPENVPAGRGGNLTPVALAEASRRLDAHASLRAPGQSYGSLLLAAGAALNSLPGGAYDLFFRSASRVEPLSGRIWNVTTLRALEHSFRGAGSAWKKAVHDWITAPDPSSVPVGPDRGKIGLCAPHSSFWLSDQSPLDLLQSRGITPGTEDAAWRVLRELALPGFETLRRRTEAMALVAVEFAADHLVDRGRTAHAWKPTALDALNFKGYCFLPGVEPDGCGLTWPLQKSLRRHEMRNGLREFVHPHIEVPALERGIRMVNILGFLSAEAKAEWDSLTAP